MYWSAMVNSYLETNDSSVKTQWIVFTDKGENIDPELISRLGSSLLIVKTAHQEWPFPTLLRYQFLLTVANQVQGRIVMHLDADMLFVDELKLSDIEKSLIQMLLEKSTSNQTATINEINYVLGVKDKNIGLQKKVRSEVFNAVNEKFKLISDWDEPLVQSIRSESDKRYFEYMIRKDMIKEAEKVLQN